jgi:uncharacterized protein with GYD domain
MPEYVMLMKLSPQGAKGHVDDLARAVDEMKKAMEALDGTMSVVVTMGEYDLVAMGHAPSDEHLAWFSSRLVASGNVTVQTLRGFSIEEWVKTQEIVPPAFLEERPVFFW